MFNKVRASVKFVFTITAIAFYFFLTFPLTLFLGRYPYQTKKLLNRLVSYVSRLVLFILDVKINVKSLPPFLKGKNYFLVSNHLGYLDILLLSSKVHTSYVTSLDIRNTPFLGTITELAGCLYVDRKNRQNINKEIIDIEMALSLGLNVTIFPEATSTNGEQILPFKRSLYQAAINSECEVLPFTINYLKVGGEKISRSNRDTLFWYGDMDFLPHLWNLCLSSKIEAELIFSESIISSGKETSVLRDLSFEHVSSNFIYVV